MQSQSIPKRISLLLILLIGAIVFSFPFLWMGSTSIKVERELFRGQLSLRPEQPSAKKQSPYYDENAFSDVELLEPQASALMPLLAEKVKAVQPKLPPSQSQSDLSSLLATGLFRQLKNRVPATTWNGNAEALRDFAGKDITVSRIAETANEAYRELSVGPVRVRSENLEDVELLPSESPAKRWCNLDPQVAALIEKTDNGLPYAAVRYDFERGNSFVLEQTFELPFNAGELNRLQLRLKPDDTWHELNVSIEAAGVRYVSKRAVSMQDMRWNTITWQKASEDDESTKLRTWVILNEESRGSQYNLGDRNIKVRLEFKHLTPLQAGFAKTKYNYLRVLDQIPFWRYVRVSVLLVILNIVLTLLSSSLVAYAFARLQWPGRDLAFLIMLGTMMIPGQVLMIPHFLIWKSVGAYDTLAPLFAGAAFGNAFFIFLMRQFLKGIPPDLEDAARIDGCGVLRIWWHVMLPLIKPSLAAIAIFTFMNTWNDFLGPLVYIADQRLYPLAFGLYAFSVQINSNPVLTMAGSMLMTVPVIIVFALAQKYFVQGITLTGMKG